MRTTRGWLGVFAALLALIACSGPAESLPADASVADSVADAANVDADARTDATIDSGTIDAACSSPNRLCAGACFVCPNDANATGTECANASCVISGCRLGFARNAEGNGCIAEPPLGDWTQQPMTTVPRPAGSISFGESVALSADGTCLVVGGNSQAQGPQGSVYVYRRATLTSAFSLSQTLTGPGNTSAFGNGVAVSGDGLLLAVADNGYRFDEPSNFIYLYARASTADNFAAPAQTLRSPSEGAYGPGVSLSSDGLHLAVGDSIFDQGEVVGVARLYQRTSRAAAFSSPSQTLVAPNASFSFGSSVSFSGDALQLAVGDAFPNDAGMVHLFARRSTSENFPSTAQSIAAPDQPEPGQQHRFGVSVGLSQDGRRLAVGDQANGNGVVYFYARTRLTDPIVAMPPALLGPNENGSLGASLAMRGDGRELFVGEVITSGLWIFTR